MPRPWTARGATAAIALVTTAVLASPALTTSALATSGHARHAAQTAQPAIVVTSVNPGFAQPGAAVTVSGYVTNPANVAVSGLTVQLMTGSPFPGRAEMQDYLGSQLSWLTLNVANPVQVPTLQSHQLWHWSVTVLPRQMNMVGFGVYPLTAQLSNQVNVVASAPTFLPFWPGGRAGRVLKPLRIAWVWPLIDNPQQVACQSLVSNELATSVASGRLDTLLTAGLAAGRDAQLTWAIDPALLGNVSAMTQHYQVGASPPACDDDRTEQASTAAKAWLHGVQRATAQDFFVTPYDDVDIAALVDRGLYPELASAIYDGNAAAHHLLGRTQHMPGLSSMLAWPADDAADYSVIEGLAGMAHTAGLVVHSVILDSNEMPATPPGVSATTDGVANTPDGQGSQLQVLLADHGLSTLLAHPSSQATAFSQAQTFLAETAMMAAEHPHVGGSVVVTPPRRWNPPAALASALLSETTAAPWLRPTSLASLASAHSPAGTVSLRPHVANPGELGKDALLGQVRRLYTLVSLLRAIVGNSGPGYLTQLRTAVDATESSAWRGSRSEQRRAVRLVRQVTDYVSGQLHQIKIIGPGQLTLGGSSGVVPVSVSNGLKEAITVRLGVSAPKAQSVTIGNSTREVTVPPGHEKTLKIQVQSAGAGSTTLSLWLETPVAVAGTKAGTALSTAPASSTCSAMACVTVQATHFGTVAIIIIVLALLLFVLSAATRAIRRGSGPGEASAPGTGPTDGGAPGTGHTETGQAATAPAVG